MKIKKFMYDKALIKTILFLTQNIFINKHF